MPTKPLPQESWSRWTLGVLGYALLTVLGILLGVPFAAWLFSISEIPWGWLIFGFVLFVLLYPTRRTSGFGLGSTLLFAWILMPLFGRHDD